MTASDSESVRQGEGGEAAAPAARLDQYVDSSTHGGWGETDAETLERVINGPKLGPLVLCPVSSRSAHDWHGGGASRWRQAAEAFRRGEAVVALAESDGGELVGVTLTMDRAPWIAMAGGDECAAARLCWRTMASKVCVAMRRSGAGGRWFRVTEVQTKSGSGWVHHHLIVALPPGLSVAEWTERIRDRWRGCGGGFVKVKRAYKTGGSYRPWLKYMVKYLAKGWAHFPPMLDDPSVLMSPRLFGSAKAVTDFAREVPLPTKRERFLRRLRHAGPRYKRKKRVLRPLVDRLDAGGTVQSIRECSIPRGDDDRLRVVRQIGRVALCRDGLSLAIAASVVREPDTGVRPPSCGKWGYPAWIPNLSAFLEWIAANRRELRRLRMRSLAFACGMRHEAWSSMQAESS